MGCVSSKKKAERILLTSAKLENIGIVRFSLIGELMDDLHSLDNYSEIPEIAFRMLIRNVLEHFPDMYFKLKIDDYPDGYRILYEELFLLVRRDPKRVSFYAIKKIYQDFYNSVLKGAEEQVEKCLAADICEIRCNGLLIDTKFAIECIDLCTRVFQN